jgi:peptidoglycan hydrolase-like protein with peptidoglycan-binding domain
MVAKFIKMVYGEKSDRVKKAQKLLAKAGSSIKPNGVYSIGMVTAVKAFQKKHKLEVTGEIDAKTMNKLAEYDVPAKKTTTRKPASRK